MSAIMSRVDTSQMTRRQLEEYQLALEQRRHEVERKIDSIVNDSGRLRELVSDEFYDSGLSTDLSVLCAGYRLTGRIDEGTARRIAESVIEMATQNAEDIVSPVEPEQFVCDED